MESDGYEVAVDLVRRHADNIVRITSQLDQVLDAANAQSIPAEAFGIICSEFHIVDWLVTPLHDRGVTSVNNTIAKADEIKKTLGAVGASYDQLESLSANQFIEKGGQL